MSYNIIFRDGRAWAEGEGDRDHDGSGCDRGDRAQS
jgi:hypothetical protein